MTPIASDLAAVFTDDKDELRGPTRHAVPFNTPAWHASLEWATAHGIDPKSIPAGSEVIRDAVAREIRYERYEVVAGQRTGAIHRAVQQVEGTIDPFPPEVLACAAPREHVCDCQAATP